MKNLLILFALLITSPALAEPTAEIITEKTRYGEISYPQLSGVADKNIEDSINKIIKEEAATWTCDYDGVEEPTEGKSFDAWSKIRFLDRKNFSYTVNKDYYCGGAYPDAHMTAHNYDLEDGVPVFVGGLLTPERTDANLTAYLLASHKFETEGCEDSYYPDTNWYFYRQPDKIVFFPSLAHVAQSCVEEFPIPLEELKPYMWAEMEEDRD